MKVMKFGGSSIRDAEHIKNACQIIIKEANTRQITVVLSAMKGITDMLILCTKKADTDKKGYISLLEKITAIHKNCIMELFPINIARGILILIDDMLNELADVLHGIELVKECTSRSLDFVMSFGERFSCTIVAAYLKNSGVPASMIDAREIILTNSKHGSAEVYLKESYSKIKQKITGIDTVPIVTGFIASSRDGATTTLGRNGSDYTASIIGGALDAEIIEIWTDVNGVLSADPRKVKTAFVIPELSFQEAMELSFFGAEVIHPSTMSPAIEKNIPIRIKNTLNPSYTGTLIAKKIKKHSKEITGIASIENVALINIEGNGMIGTPGIASKVFLALAESGVNIIMISQASSEHSICLVCREEEIKKASKTLKKHLKNEIALNLIQNFELIKELEIIAIIGENMRGTPGISGKLFNSLGKKGINILAIAQGSSERNISFVIKKSDEEKALNTIHRAFLGV